MNISKGQRKFIANLERKAAKVSRSQKMCGKSANDIAEEFRTAGDGFLSTPEWKELRSRVLATYGTCCMACKKVPKRKYNINVDHIKPRKLFPHLALEFDNLQVLCGPCNKAKGNKHSTDYRAR